MGFGFEFLQELTRAGYIPNRKCAIVVSRPTYVSTAEFAKITGLKLCYIRRLCDEGKLPCLRVSSKKFLVEWESAEQELKNMQSITKTVHSVGNNVNPNKTIATPQRKRRRAGPVVKDNDHAVKRALKKEAYM